MNGKDDCSTSAYIDNAELAHIKSLMPKFFTTPSNISCSPGRNKL